MYRYCVRPGISGWAAVNQGYVGGTNETIQKLIANLQRSIRPFKITKVTFSGNQASMSFSITMTTYYMPEKNLEIPLKEVQ